MDTLQFYRGGTLVETVHVEENSAQNKAIMGDNTITLSCVLNHAANFQAGDFTTVFGEKYLVTGVPLEKLSGKEYRYSLTLYAEGSDLKKAQYLTLDTFNNFTESDFYLMGTAQTFMDLLLKNIHRVQPSVWSLGPIEVTGFRNLNFSGDNCLTALGKIAEAFHLEYSIEGKVIQLSKKSRNTSYVFKNGIGGGLRKINRTPQSGSSIVTRIYAYGSQKNIPPNYKFSRLHLPGGYQPNLVSNLRFSSEKFGIGAVYIHLFFDLPTATGLTAIHAEYRLEGSGGAFSRETFPVKPFLQLTLPYGVYEIRIVSQGATWGPSSTPSFTVVPDVDVSPGSTLFQWKPIPYIENNVPLFGLIEGTILFEDIYPHRTGAVTNINPGNIYQFNDSDIDFDINSYLIAGVPAKITFNTGDLAGYTFDLTSFDYTTKQFTILKNKDEKALDIPSSSLKPRVGDQYVLTDIQMPQSYVENAEQELLRRAQTLLETISIHQYSYSVEIDPKAMRLKGWALQLGDYIRIQDAATNTDVYIRIVQLSRFLKNPFQYTLTLAENPNNDEFQKVKATIQTTAQGLSNLQTSVTNTAQANGRWVGDLKIEQGSIFGKDFEKRSSAAGLLPLYIDTSTGKVVVVG